MIAVLDRACEMLQCGTHLLKDALTKRTVEAGNERMATPLTAAQVCVSLCINGKGQLVNLFHAQIFHTSHVTLLFLYIL